MRRIEFSEITNRLHRNLMASASLIVLIIVFHIDVKKAATSGIELENLTTKVILIALSAVLLYHALAFCIRAFEEYREWDLKLTEKDATVWGGGVAIFDLSNKLKEVADVLQKISANTGAISHQNQTVLTADDARKLKDVSEAAGIYGNRFKNFPTITRFRFWFWDIGVSGVITLFAVIYAFSALF
jgi:hypothetical protein